jgi:hypothetical protein
MPEMHATEEELILHYYGEPLDATRADARALSAHIETCSQCRGALEELSQVLALVDAQPLPEPLAGLEQRVWARVAPEVRERQLSWWQRTVSAAPRWAWAGGAAVVVLAAFLAGRFTTPDATSPRTAEVVMVDPSVAADRVMNVAVGEHLDQSQMVLLELLNGAAGSAASLGYEQERVRDLVAANRLYRQTALQAGDEGVREVLDALERVLIEIANAPPDVSARELEALRAEIEQRGILFRLRVVSSEMRAREQNVGPSPTGP